MGAAGSLGVVGAGIVGLCVAYEGVRRGFDVTVIDPDPEGDKASFGNAGGIAVTEVVPASAPGVWKKVPFWMLDPLGPLAVRAKHSPRLAPWLWRFAQAGRPSETQRIAGALAAINNRVYDDLLPLLEATGLSGELVRKGAITVYETDGGLARDKPEWELKRRFEIDVQELSASQAREMEPALGAAVKSAVFTPQWSHVSDPKRLCALLRDWLTTRGVQWVRATAERVRPSASGAEIDGADQAWSFSKVAVAAGAWSGRLARGLGERVIIESERGYNTTIPDSGVSLQREIIFAERKFVATPLITGLRIGGAAEFGGLEAKPNYARCAALVRLARLYLPALDATGGVPWCGHRPATPDSLPVIGRSSVSRNVIYAFGHGHLGLTQAPTTARLVGDLLTETQCPIDMTPYRIDRFSVR
jgi:D-amino-acid dehydrogenase